MGGRTSRHLEAQTIIPGVSSRLNDALYDEYRVERLSWNDLT